MGLRYRLVETQQELAVDPIAVAEKAVEDAKNCNKGTCSPGKCAVHDSSHKGKKCVDKLTPVKKKLNKLMEISAKEIAAKVSAAKEKSAKESATKESAAKEKDSKEKAVKENAAKVKVAKE